jgi:phage gp16-like protein
MSASAAPFSRRRVIAAIHAAATKLGMDEEARRAMQVRVSGEHGPACESCAAMTDVQLAAVLAHLNRSQGRAFDVRADRPRNVNDKPLLRKIGALLATGRKPWAYGHALGKKLGGGERLEFCSDEVLRKVVAALEYDRRRHVARA